MAASDYAPAKHFIDQHRSKLIQNVKKVNDILDMLLEKNVINKEGYDNVRHKANTQEMMRALYEFLNSRKAKDIFYQGLKEYEEYLLDDLCPQPSPPPLSVAHRKGASASDPAVPERPEELEVMAITKESVTVAWRPPKCDGGCEVTGYVLEVRLLGKDHFSRVGADSALLEKTFTHAGLKEGSSYEFRVAAVNQVGQGRFSFATKPVECKDELVSASGRGRFYTWLMVLALVGVFTSVVVVYRGPVDNQRVLGPGGLEVKRPARTTSNAVFEPLEGFYCVSPTKEGCIKAQKHINCKPGQYIVQRGTSSTDTVCADCTGETYSDGTFTTCQQHTDCESIGLQLITPGNHSSDSTCGEISSSRNITDVLNGAFVAFVGWLVLTVLYGAFVAFVGCFVLTFSCLLCTFGPLNFIVEKYGFAGGISYVVFVDVCGVVFGCVTGCGVVIGVAVGYFFFGVCIGFNCLKRHFARRDVEYVVLVCSVVVGGVIAGVGGVVIGLTVGVVVFVLVFLPFYFPDTYRHIEKPIFGFVGSCVVSGVVADVGFVNVIIVGFVFLFCFFCCFVQTLEDPKKFIGKVIGFCFCIVFTLSVAGVNFGIVLGLVLTFQSFFAYEEMMKGNLIIWS